MIGGLRIFAVCLGVLIAGLSAAAQDLGSSNKLFGGGKAKTATTKKTAKKPAAKSKPAVSKPRPFAAKKKAAPAKPKPSAAKSKPAAAKSKAAAAKTAQPKREPVKTVKPAKPIDKTATKSKTPRFTEFKAAEPTVIKISPSQTKPQPILNSAKNDEEFEDLIEEGNGARDDRNFSAAESAYRRATTLKPKDARAVYGLGNIYSDQQRWEEAENAYRSALQIDSGSAIALIALSYVLTQPISVSNLSDRYEEAETLARRAIQYAPSNALAFDQLGVAMELRGLVDDETENAYRRAIRLDQRFAPAHAHLGRLLRKRGQIAESADAYKDAIKYSTDVSTMVLVAEVMQSELRFPESEKLLRVALDRDPKNHTALLLFARALTAQGQFADAERVLRRALEVSANGYMANILLGSLFIRQNKFEFAENALLQALRSVSTLEKRQLSQQFEAVGDGYLRTARPRYAERAFRQAITLNAENEALAGKLVRAQRG